MRKLSVEVVTNFRLILILAALLALASTACKQATDFDVERRRNVVEPTSDSPFRQKYEYDISFNISGLGYTNQRITIDELYTWSVTERDTIVNIFLQGSHVEGLFDTVSLHLNFFGRQDRISASSDGAFVKYKPGDFRDGPVVLARLDEIGKQLSGSWQSLIAVNRLDLEQEIFVVTFNGVMLVDSQTPGDQPLEINSGLLTLRAR